MGHHHQISGACLQASYEIPPVDCCSSLGEGVEGSSDAPLRFQLLLKPFVCNPSLSARSLSCSAMLIEVLTLIFQLTKDVDHFFKCFLATLCQMFTSCIFWVGGEIMGHALFFCKLRVSLIGVGMVLLNRKGLSSMFPVPFLLGALGCTPFPDYSLHTSVCLSSHFL